MSDDMMLPSPASEFAVVDTWKVPLVNSALLKTGVCNGVAKTDAIMPAIMTSIRRATNLTPTLRYCSGAGVISGAAVISGAGVISFAIVHLLVALLPNLCLAGKSLLIVFNIDSTF